MLQRARYRNAVIRLSTRYTYRGLPLEIQDTDDRLDAKGCRLKSKYNAIAIRLYAGKYTHKGIGRVIYRQRYRYGNIPIKVYIE
jgi:hypothetical protein